MAGFPDILEQDGLRLRPLTERDLPDIAAQIDDPRVATWLATVARPFDATAARALLAHAAHPGEHVRLIEQEGDLLGGICLGRALWYWLAPPFWGGGVMRRALLLAISAYFARPAPPLIATCHEDNTPSRALLARLGFAASPVGRRMFFHGTQRAEPCRDYVMAPEQWHLLHPPMIPAGRARLRPARQADTALLAPMLGSASDTPWPEADALPAFIEHHRVRQPGRGLFVVEDDHRRSIGLALLSEGVNALRFLDPQEDAKHRSEVEATLPSRAP